MSELGITNEQLREKAVLLQDRKLAMGYVLSIAQGAVMGFQIWNVLLVITSLLQEMDDDKLLGVIQKWQNEEYMDTEIKNVLDGLKEYIELTVKTTAKEM